MATRNDLRKAGPGDGLQTAIPRSVQYVDHAGRKPLGYGTHRNQNAARHEGSRAHIRRNPTGWRADPTGSFDPSRRSLRLRRTRLAGVLRQHRSEPRGGLRYGLTVADVQQAVSSGIGGAMVTENIEGRERYPVNVRYNRDFRDNVDELRRVLIGTPAGAQIPIEQVARISFSRGPSM